MADTQDIIIANYEHAATWQEFMRQLEVDMLDDNSEVRATHTLEGAATIIHDVIGTNADPHELPLSDCLGAEVLLVLNSLLTIAESQGSEQLNRHKAAIIEFISRVY